MRTVIVKETDYLTRESEYFEEASYSYKEHMRIGLLIDSMEMDVPDRFKPMITDLEGHMSVEIEGERRWLKDILGADMYGNPALVWTDPKYGYKHTASLKGEKI